MSIEMVTSLIYHESLHSLTNVSLAILSSNKVLDFRLLRNKFATSNHEILLFQPKAHLTHPKLNIQIKNKHFALIEVSGTKHLGLKEAQLEAHWLSLFGILTCPQAQYDIVYFGHKPSWLRNPPKDLISMEIVVLSYISLISSFSSQCGTLFALR